MGRERERREETLADVRRDSKTMFTEKTIKTDKDQAMQWKTLLKIDLDFDVAYTRPRYWSTLTNEQWTT